MALLSLFRSEPPTTLGLPREVRSGPLESIKMSLSAAFAWAMGSSTTTPAGEVVNEQIALQHGTVFTCVKILAEAVGTLPMILYRRQDKGRIEATDSPFYRMLGLQPNDEMRASTFWMTIVASMALNGNGYCEIERNRAKKPIGLYPLNPLVTKPKRIKQTGKLVYETYSGAEPGTPRYLDATDVLHFPLFSLDGIQGLSPIAQGKNTIGLGIAVEKFGSRFFGNGSKAGGLLTPVGDIDEATVNNFRAHWEQSQSGENQGRVAVLPGDWKYTQLSISPNDSQFLETQKLSRAAIGALFGIPPHRLGETQGLNKNTTEEQNRTFLEDALRAYIVVIEQEISCKLLPEDNTLFAEFDVADRLRGDFKSQMAGYQTGMYSGIYTTNMILEKMGENPIGPEGDVRWAPVNMQNSKRLLNLEAPPANPAAPEPGGVPTEPTGMRDYFSAYSGGFAGVFSDAVGRACVRSKRDLDSLTTIFSPTLSGIVDLMEQEARTQFQLPAEWHSSGKQTREFLKGMTTRASGWTPENRAKTSDFELRKALRALYMGIYREAAASLAESRISVSSEGDNHEEQE